MQKKKSEEKTHKSNMRELIDAMAG
jgi:hypothetical protein